MSTLTISALWDGPTPSTYPARQTVVIGTPGATGNAGPNSITTATITNFTSQRSFISNGATVIPMAISGGLQLVGNIPLTQYDLLNSDRGSVAVANLLAGDAVFGGTVQAGFFIGDGSGLTNLPSSGGMAIGGAVTGGTAGRILFEGAGPVLADNSGLTFDSTTGNITVSGKTLTSASAVVYGRGHGTITGTDHFISGIGNTATGSDGCIIIGNNCSTATRVVFVLGRDSSASAVNSMAVGNTVVVGAGGQAVGVGTSVTVSGGRGLAVAMDTTVAHRAIAFGEYADTDANGDVVFGIAGSTPFTKFKANSSTTNGRHVAGVKSEWVSNTDATRTGRVELGAYYTTTFQPGIRVDANSGGVSRLGFFGATAAAKPTITGSRGGNAALASLLTALAGLGLLTDSTTA